MNIEEEIVKDFNNHMTLQEIANKYNHLNITVSKIRTLIKNKDIKRTRPSYINRLNLNNIKCIKQQVIEDKPKLNYIPIDKIYSSSNLTYTSKIDNDVKIDVVKTKPKYKEVDEDVLDELLNKGNDLINKSKRKYSKKIDK